MSRHQTYAEKLLVDLNATLETVTRNPNGSSRDLPADMAAGVLNAKGLATLAAAVLALAAAQGNG